MRSVRGVGESRTPAPLPLWGLTSNVGRGRRALRRGPSPQLGTEGGSGTLPPPRDGGYQRGGLASRGVWFVVGACQAGRQTALPPRKLPPPQLRVPQHPGAACQRPDPECPCPDSWAGARGPSLGPCVRLCSGEGWCWSQVQ